MNLNEQITLSQESVLEKSRLETVNQALEKDTVTLK